MLQLQVIDAQVTLCVENFSSKDSSSFRPVVFLLQPLQLHPVLNLSALVHWYAMNLESVKAGVVWLAVQVLSSQAILKTLFDLSLI